MGTRGGRRCRPLDNAPAVVEAAQGPGRPPVAGTEELHRGRDEHHAHDGGVEEDSQGQAEVPLQVGSRAGVGNNVVRATVTGVPGAAIFVASATVSPAGQIVVDAGNGQLGVVGQPLPYPFIAVVTDAANNRLGGVPV